VFLAFDARINRLVELHILKAGGSMSSVEKRSALERATLAADVRAQVFHGSLRQASRMMWCSTPAT